MQVEDNSAVSIGAPQAAEVDGLRPGLLLLCQRLGRPLTDAELVDGIALDQGRLPLRLVPRALRRADLNADVLDYPLAGMDAYLLPALLLLHDGRTLLLEAIESENARVLLPHASGGEQTMPLSELERLYSGSAVFAKPRFRDDGRIGGYAGSDAEHWFYGPLKKLWRSYAEVATAAMVANLLAIATTRS